MRIVRVLAYTTILCISGAGFETAAAQSSPQQTQFCKLISDFMEQKRAYSAEANPLRRAELHAPDPMQAETTVKGLFQPKNNEFTDWIGDVRFTVVGQNVSVTFIPECTGVNLWLISFRNSMPMSGLPPESLQTTISVNSEIGRQLKALPANASRARVSGHLVPFSSLSKFNSVLSGNRNRGPSTYRASNGISGASVENPNYLVKFESISPEAPSKSGVAPQTTGTANGTKVLSASYDVLGLRPGMGSAEVDQLLRTKFGPSVNITTTTRPRRYTNGGEFVMGESLHTEQFTLLLSYAEAYPGLFSGPEVLTSIDYEPNLEAAADKADFVKRVVEKFGQPTRIFDQQEYYWATQAYSYPLAFDQSDGPVLHLTTYKPQLLLNDTSIARRMEKAFNNHSSATKPPL